VDDQIAMRVGNAGAHLQEQRDTLAYREATLGAIPIDGHALHVLHHEV
jgi:hypothetical protein